MIGDRAEAVLLRPSRPLAIVEGVLVTLIWASSFVLVKKALDGLGPLTIAWGRYLLGFVFLLPFVYPRRAAIRALPPRLWLRLLLIGLSSYTIGNGMLFWGLKYLPPMTVSLLGSTLPIIILVVGIFWLSEIPTRWQVLGVLGSVAGGVIFFSSGLAVPNPLGLVFVAAGQAGFAAFALLGRDVARSGEVDTLVLTAVPLALGGVATLLIALPVEGLPAFAPQAWRIVLILALVNTALGYVLYNHALRVLTAFELNTILNFIPLATAVFAWRWLGDRLTPVQIVGMIVVIMGVFFVQWGRTEQRECAREPGAD